MEGKFFKRAPLLVGSNTAEGQEVLVQLLPDMEEREVLYLTLGELDASLARIFPENSEPLQSLIKFQYGMFGEGGNRTEMAVRRFWGLESVLADLRTVCPVARIAASIGAEGTSVYRYFGSTSQPTFYQFTHPTVHLILNPTIKMRK